MKSYLYVKKNKYYVVIPYKKNGERKTKWISTGLDKKGHKKEAEELRKKLTEEFEKTLLGKQEEKSPSRPLPHEQFTDEEDTLDILFCDEAEEYDEDEEESDSLPPVMSGPQFPMFQQSPQIPPEQFMTMVQMYMPFLQQMAAMMGNQGVPFDFRQTKIKGEVVNSMITVADFIPYWEEFYKEQVSLNSYNHDVDFCRLHITPYFAAKGTRLCELDTEILQEFIDYQRDYGNTRGGINELSPKSLRNLKSILSSICKYANMKCLLPNNPALYLKLPPQINHKVSYFNEEQLQTLFDKIKDEEIFPIIYITAIYGLRRSEVLGLKWDSIDFDHKMVEIKHTVVRYKEVVEKDTCKSRTSERVYPMTDKIEELLLKQKENEAIYKMYYGKYYEKSDYVFKWPYGKMYDPNYISREFRKLLKKNNLPPIRFHDLRHSCASLLIAKGYNIEDIKEWLGHADIQMTSNIYGHFEMKRKMAIADKIDF